MPWHGRERTPVPSSIFDYKHGFIFLRKDSVASTAAKANSPISSLWLANCYFSLAAGHVALLHFVLGFARIELVVADSKGIGAGKAFWLGTGHRQGRRSAPIVGAFDGRREICSDHSDTYSRLPLD